MKLETLNLCIALILGFLAVVTAIKTGFWKEFQRDQNDVDLRQGLEALRAELKEHRTECKENQQRLNRMEADLRILQDRQERRPPC